MHAKKQQTMAYADNLLNSNDSSTQRRNSSEIETIFKGKSPDEIGKGLESAGIEHIKVGIFDMDGILRGKYMKREKFVSALKGGFGF